jgi:hypothetical protein
VKTVLLRNSPGLTYKLLKEVAGEEDVIGPCGASEETIAVKFSHGHMFVLQISWCILILNSGIEDVEIPTKLASGEQEDIAQGGDIVGWCQRCAEEVVHGYDTG